MQDHRKFVRIVEVQELPQGYVILVKVLAEMEQLYVPSVEEQGDKFVAFVEVAVGNRKSANHQRDIRGLRYIPGYL